MQEMTLQKGEMVILTGCSQQGATPAPRRPAHTSATPPCPNGYGIYVCSGTQTQTHAGQSRFRAKRVLPARRTPDIPSTYGATGKCTPVAGQRATGTASPGYECIRIFFLFGAARKRTPADLVAPTLNVKRPEAHYQESSSLLGLRNRRKG